jgi:branched-chain amino acid transport system substrate-binding protein
MITRRTLLKTSAATGLTIAAGGLAAPAIAQGAKIKLGYVSPQSGPLAAFAEADSFILSNFGATRGGCELRNHRQGQPVQPEPGRGSGQGTDRR